MNRLDHAISNLQNTATNLATSKGRIMDADFAAESANLARTQVLQQASMAMLSQANASKQRNKIIIIGMISTNLVSLIISKPLLLVRIVLCH